MLIVLVLVLFIYFGGSNVPKVLRDNKELLLGLTGGLVLCSFFNLRLEGIPGRPSRSPLDAQMVPSAGGRALPPRPLLASSLEHDEYGAPQASEQMTSSLPSPH